MTPPAAAYVANASTMPFKMFAMIQKTNDVAVPTMYMVSALHTEPISMHHFGEMMSMIFTPIALMANESIVATVGPIVKVVRLTCMPSSRNGTIAFMTDVPPEALAKTRVTPTAAETLFPLL